MSGSARGNAEIGSAVRWKVLVKADDYTAGDYDVGESDPHGKASRFVMFVGGTLVATSVGEPEDADDQTFTDDFAGMVLPLQLAKIDSTSTATYILLGW